MQAPILMETLMGQGFVGGLLCCVACEGNDHSTTPHALHPIPQSRCRGHVDLFRASLTVAPLQQTCKICWQKPQITCLARDMFGILNLPSLRNIVNRLIGVIGRGVRELSRQIDEGNFAVNTRSKILGCKTLGEIYEQEN